MPLGTEVGLGPGYTVLDGDTAPPKRGHFSAHVYCGQTAGWIKMPLDTEVGLSPGDIVLDGDPASPQFSAHVCSGQMTGQITIPLGTEVGLGLDHEKIQCATKIVLRIHKFEYGDRLESVGLTMLETRRKRGDLIEKCKTL